MALRASRVSPLKRRFLLIAKDRCKEGDREEGAGLDPAPPTNIKMYTFSRVSANPFSCSAVLQWNEELRVGGVILVEVEEAVVQAPLNSSVFLCRDSRGATREMKDIFLDFQVGASEGI